MDRILFYETFEFLEDILSEEIPHYAELRHQSRTYSLQVFLDDEEPLPSRSALQSLCIPPHLLHHTARIYDFYFGVDSPINFKIEQSILWEVQTQYFSGQPSVTWIDAAIQQVLRDLYSEVFPGFVKEVRAIVDLFNLTARTSTPDSISQSLCPPFSDKEDHVESGIKKSVATLDRVQNEKQLDRIYSHLSLRMTNKSHTGSSLADKRSSLYSTPTSLSSFSSTSLLSSGEEDPFGMEDDASRHSFEALSRAWSRNSPRYKQDPLPDTLGRGADTLDVVFSFYDPSGVSESGSVSPAPDPRFLARISQLFRRRERGPIQLSSVTTSLYLDTAGLNLLS